jgi:hypothetical protein
VTVPLPSFTPKDWQNDPAGGTPITETELDLRDNALAQLIAYVDQLSDTVRAIQATVGNTGQQIINEIVVTPTTRGNPTLGRRVYDTTLLKPIWGDGSNWRDSSGTILTGANATSAPQNMTAVVNPDNSILLSWDAVAGATSYKLYETQSPNGVSGATTLTTTSTLRTPSTQRNYEYWVTATVGGIESAASNHVFPTLPYGSTTGSGGSGSSGGGFTGSPAQFLNIGGAGGYWNLGIGYPTGHVDISYAELHNGFTDSPYFVMNVSGTAVVFWTPMNGGRTSSATKYPRTELRELQSDGITKAAWSGTSGRHRLQYKAKVMHYAPVKCEMCCGQIHDASDDVLQIRPEAASATGSQTWRLSIKGIEVKDLIAGVSLGQEVQMDIDLNAGTLSVKVNGTSQWSSSPGYASSGNYFKVGSYPQQNSTDQANSPTDYASVEIRDLILTHT